MEPLPDYKQDRGMGCGGHLSVHLAEVTLTLEGQDMP